MEGNLHGIDIFTSSNITTLIWVSQKVVCWRAGFSAVPAAFLVPYYCISQSKPRGSHGSRAVGHDCMYTLCISMYTLDWLCNKLYRYGVPNSTQGREIRDYLVLK